MLPLLPPGPEVSCMLWLPDQVTFTDALWMKNTDLHTEH